MKRNAKTRIISIILMLSLLMTSAALGIVISAADDALPSLTANVPTTDVAIIDQDFEDVANNPIMGVTTEASHYGVLTDRMVIKDADDGYNGGKYADFDYSTYAWSTWESKSGSGGSINIGYPIGQFYYGGPQSDKLADYVPSGQDGYVLTFNFRNVTGFEDEYLWVNVMATAGTSRGYKIRTNEFKANVWYEIKIVAASNTYTATKTELTGENKGQTSTLTYESSLVSSSRKSQAAIMMVPLTSGDLSEARQAARFSIDNIKLTTTAYDTTAYTHVIAEQDYQDLSVNSTFTLNSTTGHTPITIVEDGNTGNYVADFDYSELYANAEAMSPYGSGLIYTGTSNRADQLPFVPSAAAGYTVTFKYRDLSESTKDLNDRIWFSVYDSSTVGGRGFSIKTSAFDKGIWYEVTVTNNKNVFTATATALDGENAGVTADIRDKLTTGTAVSTDRTNQFCYTIYSNSNDETVGQTSAERYLAHYQMDDICLSTKLPLPITVDLPDGITAASSSLPLLVAYDTKGVLSAIAEGKITDNNTAEFDLLDKYATFADADSVKALWWDGYKNIVAYASPVEIGNDIHPKDGSPVAYTEILEISSSMNPSVSGAMSILVYTVSNVFDSSSIPDYKSEYTLLYAGQSNTRWSEISYNKALYDYQKEDIVVKISNGTDTVTTLIENYTPPKHSNIVINLGSDKSELNFTWFSISEEAGSILYAKESELVNGSLPTNAKSVDAQRTNSKKENYYGNKATITGLEAGTTYYYVIKNGNDTTEPKPVSIAADEGFTFAFAGDPQIGRGYGSTSGFDTQVPAIEMDGVAWGRTLSQIVNSKEFEGTDFLMSAGDQINSTLHDYGYTYHEEQWNAYSNHDELLSLPQVNVLGNHDDEPYAPYPFHTNAPNMLTKEDGSYYCPSYELRGDKSVVLMGDYYFTYGKALFMVLNTNLFVANDDSAEDTAKDKAIAEEHGEFIERVMDITKDMDIRWTIVLYHESPYGSSYHGNYTVNANGVYNRTEQYAFINMRTYLLPILYENGVDLVLSGHDHSYTRTHVIKPAQDENGNYIDASIITPYEDGNYVYADGSTTPTFINWKDATGVYHSDLKVSSKPVSVTNPDGMVHVTGATSSGSQVNAAQYENLYAAVIGKANTRQLSKIIVTDTELTIITYNMGTSTTDDIVETDRFTIYQSCDEGHDFRGGRCARCNVSETAEDEEEGKWTPDSVPGIKYAAWASEADYLAGKKPLYISLVDTLDTTKIATVGTTNDDYEVDYIAGYVHLFDDAKITNLITLGTKQHLVINLGTHILTDSKGFRLVKSQVGAPDCGLEIKNGTYNRTGGALQCRSDTTLVLEKLNITFAANEFITAQSALIHIKDCNINFTNADGAYITLNGINNNSQYTEQRFIIEGTTFTGNVSSDGFLRFKESTSSYHPKWNVTIDSDTFFDVNFPQFAVAYEAYTSGKAVSEFSTVQTITFEEGVQFSSAFLASFTGANGGAQYLFVDYEDDGSSEKIQKFYDNSIIKIDFVDATGASTLPESGNWWMMTLGNTRSVSATGTPSKFPIVAYNKNGTPYIYWDAPRIACNADGTFETLVLSFLDSGTTITLYDDVQFGQLATYEGYNLTIDLNGHSVNEIDNASFQLGYNKSGVWQERVIRIISSADTPGTWTVTTGTNQLFQPRPGTIFYAENVSFTYNGTFMYGYCKDARFVNCEFTSRNSSSLFVSSSSKDDTSKYSAAYNMDFDNREYRVIIFDNCKLNSPANISSMSIVGTDACDIVFMNGCVINNKNALLVNTGSGTAYNNIFFDIDTKFTASNTSFYTLASDSQKAGVYFYSDITSYEDVVNNKAIVEGLSMDDYEFTLNGDYYSYTYIARVAVIEAASVTIGSDLAMNYFITVPTTYDLTKLAMRFTMNGKTVTVSEYVFTNGEYVFKFTGIAPQCMGDEIVAEVIYDEEVVASLDKYSVKKNAENLIKNADAALKALLADMLNYGAEAQLYKGYKTDALVNTGIEGATSSLPTEDDDKRSATFPENEKYQFVSIGVRFDYDNKIYAKFTAESTANLTVRINGEEVEFNLENGEYVAYSEGISALKFADVYTFELVLDGMVVQSITYSVNSYAYAMANNAEIGELATALYRYGKSAINYKKNN